MRTNTPTILVILGITGDLAAKKIVPAIFNLNEKGQLPERFAVVGFGRRDWGDNDLRDYLREVLAKKVSATPEQIEKFLEKFSYLSGNFDEKKSYTDLNQRLQQQDKTWQSQQPNIKSNKLFYLSVPPNLYAGILNNLHSSGLTAADSQEQGWTRVLVEKPFGKDLKTAQELDELLGRLFKEEQIYRIDHYLAKEMVQNILTFRFANDLFERAWGSKFVEKIEIRLWETLGVEQRGHFYDQLGAMRDVGQNHLLQMLALVTMDHPGEFNSESIRPKRAELLKTLAIPTEKQIVEHTFRAQYEGYKNIEGVKTESDIETYFRATLYIDHPRWRNVPVMIESGKRFSRPRKEIVVTFRHTIPCLCPPGQHLRNKVIFSLEPDESIKITFWAKKPGLDYELQSEELNFTLREGGARSQYVEEYEKLIVDSISGDQTLFVSTDEIQAMWKVIDPIICAWDANKVPLGSYKPDTDEAAQKADAAAEKTAGSEKHFGIIGLGKMGGNLVERMLDQGWKVHGWNRSTEPKERLAAKGMIPAATPAELIAQLPEPKVVWLMLPAGDTTDEYLFGAEGIVQHLKPGDIVIDGGNSFYEDSIRRAKLLEEKGIDFLDCGTSGGPGGARSGPSLMIGGRESVFKKIEPLFADMAKHDSYKFFEGHGAGHFVKMVHNGIEYGMMQALAEGFAIMKKIDYNLDLSKVADIYNHGSVIESRLVGWLQDAFAKYGQDLEEISPTVAHTGEGAWTVQTAHKLNIKAKIIEESLNFRITSAEKPSYTGKVLSALRNMFGGHKAK